MRSQADLNGGDTTESPEVTVAYPIKFFLYLLHNAASDVETIVGTVRGLGVEAHGRIVAVLEIRSDIIRVMGRSIPATSLRIFIESTRAVPRETKENRPKGTI